MVIIMDWLKIYTKEVVRYPLLRLGLCDQQYAPITIATPTAPTSLSSLPDLCSNIVERWADWAQVLLLYFIWQAMSATAMHVRGRLPGPCDSPSCLRQESHRHPSVRWPLILGEIEKMMEPMV